MHAEQLASLKCAATQHEAALQAATTSPSTRDSTILNLQEENAALHAQVSELRYRTDADYPFDTVQRTALIFFLSNVPVEARFQVTIRYSGFAGNSDYPRRMARAFREAGWNAQIIPDVGIQSTNEGIHLASYYTSTGELEPLSADGEVLREALERTGISFHLSGQKLPDGFEKRPSFFFCVFPPSI